MSEIDQEKKSHKKPVKVPLIVNYLIKNVIFIFFFLFVTLFLQHFSFYEQIISIFPVDNNFFKKKKSFILN